jgi:hypothetical protein
MRAQWFGA